MLFGLEPGRPAARSLQRRAASRPPRRSRPSRAGIAYLPEDRRRHGVVLDLPVDGKPHAGRARRVSRARRCSIAPKEQRVADGLVQTLAIKTPSLDTPVRHLSGGNQQKVALGRWLVRTPSLLILDEPTQGVDVGAKAEIHGSWASWPRRGWRS